jgi:hypothetical protein
MNRHIPCIDCVAFAMCKSRMPSYELDKSKDDIQFEFSQLYNQCSLIKEHLDNYYTTVQRHDPLVVTVSFEPLYEFYYPDLYMEMKQSEHDVYFKQPPYKRTKEIGVITPEGYPTIINPKGYMTIIDPSDNGAKYGNNK